MSRLPFAQGCLFPGRSVRHIGRSMRLQGAARHAHERCVALCFVATCGVFEKVEIERTTGLGGGCGPLQRARAPLGSTKNDDDGRRVVVSKRLASGVTIFAPPTEFGRPQSFEPSQRSRLGASTRRLPKSTTQPNPGSASSISALKAESTSAAPAARAKGYPGADRRPEQITCLEVPAKVAS
jgi:hypothetical protein